MAFESLTERLNGVFKKLRGKGKLNEADIKAAMREVRMALLEADVNYKVAKDFCAQVSEPSGIYGSTYSQQISQRLNGNFGMKLHEHDKYKKIRDANHISYPY